MMKITKTFFVISLLTIGLLSFGSSYDLVFKMEKDLEKEYKENLDIVFTSSFQERMDELSLAKTEFVMGHLWDLVNRERFLDAEELQDLIALKQKYNDLVKLYGKTEDFKRSSVFKAYVKKSISLIREKRGLGRLKKIGSFSLQGLFRVKYFDLVKDLYDYYSRKNSHRNDIMNPFLRASGNVGEALLKAPIKIEMNGFRFNNDEINVIFMNHPQSKIDNVIVTKVLNSFQGEKIIIANAEGFKRDLLFKEISLNQGFVFVGTRNGKKYNKATQRIETLFDSGHRTVFIFPEGSTSSGLGETKLINKGLSRVLLRKIIKKHKVNLIGFTSLDNYKILGHLDETKEFRSVLSFIMKSDQLEEVLRERTDELSYKMRGSWLSQLPTNEQRFLGQYRIQKILSEIDRLVSFESKIAAYTC